MPSQLRQSLWLAVATVVLAMGSPAWAKQTESRIIGKVLDSSKGVLPGSTVTVRSASTGATRETVVNDDGSFTITSLSPGTYQAEAGLAGFQSQVRDVVLGVGQIETVQFELGVAALTETVAVNAQALVLDLSSAKIGVNVSPEEVASLPVNGRNFANLMTLATGGTSDGNGGWASVRFNGKSNQQNYLNYDGVDGTYVWDASPGYLSSTGSQFRLQTSMESVAEFRVNSGLAPAESGLGAGGNITVVTKSGTNNIHGSVFEYKRDDALDAASKYDNKKQPLTVDQFGGWFGGPLKTNRAFLFVSFEGLRQDTGLSFTEAVPSAEARRRITAGEPIGAGAGQSAARTRAALPLLNGFPAGQVATSNPLVDLATLQSQATQTENTMSLRLDHRFSDTHYYPVVKEANGLAKPFFVDDNEFGSDPNNFYNADRNNIAPRLSAAYQVTDKTVVRAGFGLYYGPGQFEDRIQPIENYIERRRVQASDIANNGLAYPLADGQLRNLLSLRGYTHDYPTEYNIQYGGSLSRELPGAVNLTIGYTGSQGRDMFLRGVGNVLDPVTRVRLQPAYGQIDFKTGGCVDDVKLGGVYGMTGCGRASYDALQLSGSGSRTEQKRSAPLDKDEDRRA